MRVLIAAGGTAGHINPALAIAGAIKKADPSAEIHFAGRKEGMEYRLVTQAGYPFHHIEITGFQRRLSLNNIKRNIITLWNLALSGPKARAMMKEVQPDLVIGCGGYVSGPVVRCAAKKGIKTAIHEQNAFPGVTNKLLAPDVDIVFAAVPAAVEKLGAPEKTQVVGNPVRPEVFEKAGERDAIRAQLGAGDRTVILSFGGSLGARRVNEVVADLCAWEQKEHKPVLHIHATGQYGVELFQNLEKEKGFAPGESLVVKEYINNMPELLAAADLVISRAGALTLAELEAEGRAAILIPLTYPPATSPHTYLYTSCALIHIRIRTRIRAPIRTHAHAHPHTLPPANIHRVIHIICAPSEVMHLSTVFAYPVARKPYFCILFGHGYHSRSDDGHHNSHLAGNRAARGAADTVYQGSAGTAQP